MRAVWEHSEAGTLQRSHVSKVSTDSGIYRAGSGADVVRQRALVWHVNSQRFNPVTNNYLFRSYSVNPEIGIDDEPEHQPIVDRVGVHAISDSLNAPPEGIRVGNWTGRLNDYDVVFYRPLAHPSTIDGPNVSIVVDKWSPWISQLHGWKGTLVIQLAANELFNFQTYGALNRNQARRTVATFVTDHWELTATAEVQHVGSRQFAPEHSSRLIRNRARLSPVLVSEQGPSDSANVGTLLVVPQGITGWSAVTSGSVTLFASGGGTSGTLIAHKRFPNQVGGYDVVVQQYVLAETRDRDQFVLNAYQEPMDGS